MICHKVKVGRVGCNISFNKKDILLQVEDESDNQIESIMSQVRVVMTLEETERLITKLQTKINTIVG